MTIHKITQDDIDTQNKSYSKDYLAGVVAGDLVYDDGEVFASKSCVFRWQSQSNNDKDHNRYEKILEKLG